VSRGDVRIHEVAPEEWDRLLEGFPDRTVFHSLGWLKAVERAYGYRLVLAAARTDAGCVAVWPCVEKRKFTLRVLGSPMPGTSTPYLGPLFAPGADVPAVVAAFLKDSTIGRHAFFACRTWELSGEPVNLEPAFTRLLRFETLLIDLTRTEEELWAGLTSECRNRVRKARKSGFTVRVEPDGGFLDEFWSLSVEVFAKSHRLPTYSKDFLRHMWNNLASEGRVLALSAFLGEERAATLVLPYDHQNVYYWAGGARSRFNTLAPGNLLHWEAFLEARRRGLSRYDFVSSKGDAGRFKRTFGPTPRDVATHWERSRSRLVAALKRRYTAHLYRKQRVR
jgi:CelD/BcsL family acetyltransferase involved in cellulose biosynthesis